MKKAFFGITLIIGIGICLGLLFFPILEFDREAIYENHKEEIENEIVSDIDETKTYEEKKDAVINEIIYNVCGYLQMYTKSNDIVYDEDGNEIESGNDNEAIMFDLYELKEDGIKYTDLAKGLKNQFEYNLNVYKVLKKNGNLNLKVLFDSWYNPFPMLGLVLLIALEFACCFLLIIRSVKGVLEKKRNKVLIISLFGAVISVVLLFLSTIFKTNIELIEVNSTAQFVRLLAMSIKGTMVCKYAFIAFLASTMLSIVAKFMKY